MNKANPKPMFDFNETYFRNEKSQMSKLRKFKDVLPSAGKELIVETNGRKTNFKLESDGEYYDGAGMGLTKALEFAAGFGNSKVSIYERKGI